ncbi:hypothetical protein H920_07596 [Fukomys damarensis]|uniref:Homeobox domain-containing protein n=1 Tax=Fukomys damarensis TaxID=885580 RepID=A0A091E7A1_FUKDA|nr:hypothetical protein H920_07596 [Fukomys damarensis]
MRTKTCHVKVQDPNDECNCAVYLKCTNKLNENKQTNTPESSDKERSRCAHRPLQSSSAVVSLRDLMLHTFDMTSKGSSVKEDNHNEEKGPKPGRRRSPHRFTNDDLQILKRFFEKNTYPAFRDKEELANRIHCHVYVIENTQAQSASCFTKEASFPHQEAPLGGTGLSSLETQSVAAGKVASCGFLAMGMNMEASSTSEHPESSVQADNQNEERGPQCERHHEKGRQRHRLKNDDIQILKQFFQQNPYPDLTVKQELASEIHCDVYVIDKWFRNRRTRLPPEEKQRVFAFRIRHQFPVEESSFPGDQNTQAPPANYSFEKFSFPCRESSEHGSENSSMETQQGPVGQVDSSGFLATSTNMDPICASEYQDGSGSVQSFRPIPTKFIYSMASGQYPDSICFESQG